MLRQNIERLFRPKSIALVGASEKLPQAVNTVNFMRASQSRARLFLVNPNRTELFGEAAYPSLESIGQPVDAIMGLVNAERAIELVGEAVATGAGGVVVHADGFSEAGDDGAAKEARLVAAAQGKVAVLGPNCNGFVDLNGGVKLSGAPPVAMLPGPIGLIAHSGALMTLVASSAHGRGLGVAYMISTGNEAVVDVADCIEFLIDDPQVKTICLVIETIRRPAAFFAAARRAAEMNKPIIALKLGRSALAQAIVSSHTGAVAGEAWAYDAAMRQHGVAIARDIGELTDRAAYFTQLPVSKWTKVDGLAVLTPTGGGASLMSDIFGEHDLPMPELHSVKPKLAELLPNAKVTNPLDMTGSVVVNAALGAAVLDLYGSAAEADTLLMQWFGDDAVMTIGAALLEQFSRMGGEPGKTVLYGSMDDGALGEWTGKLRENGIAVTRGLIGTARALQTMRNFGLHRERLMRLPRPAPASVSPRPDLGRLVASSAGPMLDFAAAMELVAAAGIRVAPYRVVAHDASLEDALADLERDGLAAPFVVKVADVPHRTDIGAVRLNVGQGDLAATVTELRDLARRLGLPGAVAVQAQLRSEGEAFLGINNDSGLGPMVICGLGGIFMEVFKRVVGLVAPYAGEEALSVLGEIADTGVFEGLRGGRPWDRARLAKALLAAGALAEGTQGWMSTLDINPLLYVDGEFVAVDALAILRPAANGKAGGDQ